MNIKTICINEACNSKNLIYTDQYICPFCKKTLEPQLSADIPSIFITNINEGPSSIANALYRILISSSNYKKLNFISDSFIAGMRIFGDMLIGVY